MEKKASLYILIVLPQSFHPITRHSWTNKFACDKT